MLHKAYAFNWRAFESDELSGLILQALETDDSSGLFRYIKDRHNSLKDPYLGNPLHEYWLEMLENRDVQEYGDFALTCFYDPAGDWGIGNRWIEIDELLFESHRSALLGFSIGSVGKLFDPGGMGSYFQTPEPGSRV